MNQGSTNPAGMSRAVISLATELEDPEHVSVAFLVRWAWIGEDPVVSFSYQTIGC